ncbi:Bax inhibitor 1 [Clonorchis sinensis]|uniref:Bax inhibitor 1 n=1 Tax=Clonorchis sinensis TaxID=79923 RepID=A0A8T1MXQ7_CLOSI|nr:Bax inhibitor 1 [Clonorchis sinensis]
MNRDPRFRQFSWQSMFTFNDIDKHVQVHLKNVYSTLSVGLILSCVAAYAFTLSTFLQSMTTMLMVLSFITTLGSSLYIYFTPHSTESLSARLFAFFLFAFSTGLGFGPLLRVISIINPETIPTALLGAAVIFVSFSLASLFTRKRYYLYLGALLMSAMSMLATFSFVNLFMRSPAIYQAELYIGLMLFCGFVVFDTQMIVEKRKCGDTDFIWHTLDLFVDFVELFRHLLIILNSKRNRRENDD